jgi:hypothetical protein
MAHFSLRNMSNAVPVKERAKARVCNRSFAGISGSNPATGMDVCLL